MAKKIETAAKATAAKAEAIAKTTTKTEGTEMTNATQATEIEVNQANAAIVAGVIEDAGATTPAATTEPAAPKATPKYIVQRNKRQRFSFGNTWINAVLAGVVSDHAKLVAHGVKLNAGTQAELEKLDMEALLPIVQKAIMEEPAPEPEITPDANPVVEPAAEAPAEEVAA